MRGKSARAEDRSKEAARYECEGVKETGSDGKRLKGELCIGVRVYVCLTLGITVDV